MGYNHVADNTTFIYTPAIDASQICKFREFCDNSIYSSRSSKVTNLGTNRSEYATSYLLLGLTLDVSPSPTVFEILTHLARK